MSDQRTYCVEFCVGADDSYYWNKFYVHGLTLEDAAALVSAIQRLADIQALIMFDAAVMKEEADAERPDLGYDQWTKPSGAEVRVKGHDIHVYPQG